MSVVCVGCGSTLIPALGGCFDCEIVTAAAPQRTLRRYRVHGSVDGARLTTLLAALAPNTPAPEVAWIVSQRVFDLVAELTDAQEQMLLRVLGSAGAPSTLSFGTAPIGLRIVRDRSLVVKGGVAASFGIATAVLGIPLVPIAAGATIIYLAVRGVRVARREITLPRARVDQMLGALDQKLISEARTARAGIETREVLDLTRDALACVCEILTTVRTESAHLTTPEMQRADVEVTQVAVDFLRLSAKTDGLTRPRANEESYRAPDRAADGAMTLLKDLHAKLTEARDAARLVRPGEAPGTALANLVRGAVRLRQHAAEALGTLHGVGTPTPPGSMPVVDRLAPSSLRN